MAFISRHIWATTWLVTATACALFAAVFYPRGVDIEDRLAYAAERKAADDLLQEGMKAYATGDRETARRYYEESLAMVEDDYQGQIVMGLLEFEDGNFEEANAHFDRACALWEVNPDARNSRGVTRWRLGDRRGAMRDLNRAVALNPMFDRARTNRGTARLAMGDLDAAREDFEATMDDEESLLRVPRAVMGFGIVNALRGNLEEAETSFSLLADPRMPRSVYGPALANRAKVYEELGETDRAAKDRAALKELERSDLASDSYPDL